MKIAIQFKIRIPKIKLCHVVATLFCLPTLPMGKLVGGGLSTNLPTKFNFLIKDFPKLNNFINFKNKNYTLQIKN